MLVGITFLPTLSSLEPAPNLLDPLRRLEYHLGTPHNPLTNLTPAYRGTTLPPIQHFEGRTVDTRMIAIIIGELRQQKVSIPTTSKI